MKFTIVIYSAPYSTQASYTALRFCESLLQQNHSIYRVFFFRDAVHTTSTLAVIPQDECDIQKTWQEFLGLHDIDSVACVSSALKRGILDAKEAMRYDRQASNMQQNIQIAGLGQLVDACLNADRVMQFG